MPLLSTSSHVKDIKQVEEDPLIKSDQVIFAIHDNPLTNIASDNTNNLKIKHVKDIYRIEFQKKGKTCDSLTNAPSTFYLLRYDEE